MKSKAKPKFEVGQVVVWLRYPKPKYVRITKVVRWPTYPVGERYGYVAVATSGRKITANPIHGDYLAAVPQGHPFHADYPLLNNPFEKVGNP